MQSCAVTATAPVPAALPHPHPSPPPPRPATHELPCAAARKCAISRGSNDVLLDRQREIRLVPLNEPVVRFRLRAISKQSLPANESGAEQRTQFCLGPWQSCDPAEGRVRGVRGASLKPQALSHMQRMILETIVFRMTLNGIPHARHTAAGACSSLIDKFIVVIVFLLLVRETTSTLLPCNTNKNTIVNFKIYSATSGHTVPTVHAVATHSVERHRILKSAQSTQRIGPRPLL